MDADFLIYLSYEQLESSIYQTVVEQSEAM